MKVSARHKARELALQGIYSWQMSKNDIAQVELALATSNDMQGMWFPHLHQVAKNRTQNPGRRVILYNRGVERPIRLYSD